MVAVGLVALDLGHRARFARLQVHQLQGALRVEEREGAVVGRAEHQPAAVRRGLGVAGRGVVRAGAPDGVRLLGDAAGIGVEGGAHQVVFDVLDLLRDRQGVGHAIIDGLTVGGEAREGLELVGPRDVRNVDHQVVVEVRDRQVGGRVVDLHPFARQGVEARDDDVGREDAETARRVQFAVDGAGEHALRVERQLAELAVLVEDGAAVRAADVVEGIVPARLAVDVAVHAGVVGMLVVADDDFVEILDAALHDGHFVEHLVGRLDEAVGQVAVDGVFADEDPPAVADRLAFDLGRGLDLDGLAGRVGQEGLPRAYAPFDLGALERDGLAVHGEGRARLADALHRIAEVQRRDVGRDGYFLVVRINHQGAFAARHGRGILTVAATLQRQAGRRKEK